MSDKVVYEFRFIETEDGFRFEFNGDKEQLKKMVFGPGMCHGSGFDWGMGHWGRNRGGYRSHRRKHGPGFTPPWTWWWDKDDEPEGEPTPPKDRV